MRFLIIFSIVILIIIFILVGFFYKTDNKSTAQNTAQAPNVQVNRTSTEQTPVPPKEQPEQELSTFSTKIVVKDSARNHNIELTCNTLNGTIVKAGETFSFTETVGKATPEKGYEKADVFDTKGNVTKGYGGGNCQISSTLYNAVLELTELEVVERHPHSKKVTYVPER